MDKRLHQRLALLLATVTPVGAFLLIFASGMSHVRLAMLLMILAWSNFIWADYRNETQRLPWRMKVHKRGNPGKFASYLRTNIFLVAGYLAATLLFIE